NNELKSLNLEMQEIMRDINSILNNKDEIKNLFVEKEYNESSLKEDYSKDEFKKSLDYEMKQLEDEFKKMNLELKKTMKRMSLENENVFSNLEIKNIDT